jgi:diadenosine tetraphosphate (Ap4A) HIT family hydrolase
MNRSWDPQNKYKEGFLKEYKHWALEISFHQHTLGCFIIFAKRDIEKISELNDEELLEIKIVMAEIEPAITKAFQADRFNYLQLGNNSHRLHFHGIPRYQTEREFNGQKWIDKTFGHPPIWKDEESSEELVKAIKEKILPVI